MHFGGAIDCSSLSRSRLRAQLLRSLVCALEFGFHLTLGPRELLLHRNRLVRGALNFSLVSIEHRKRNADPGNQRAIAIGLLEAEGGSEVADHQGALIGSLGRGGGG